VGISPDASGRFGCLRIKIEKGDRRQTSDRGVTERKTAGMWDAKNGKEQRQQIRSKDREAEIF
jgi:hypothetical protein